MIGVRLTAQGALFYGFSLERHVPADHLLRSIDRFVDLGNIRQHLPPFYSETGRPSLVLSARVGRRRAGPFHLLQEPPRPLP
jgi:hypothetical protein